MYNNLTFINIYLYKNICIFVLINKQTMENLQSYILGILEYSDYLQGINEFEKRCISVHVHAFKVTFKFYSGEKIHMGGDPTRMPEDIFFEDDYWFTLNENFNKVDIFKGVEDFCSYLDEHKYFIEEIRL